MIKLILLIISLIIFIFPQKALAAASYTNFQLTNNDSDDTNLVAAGDKLVWFRARRGYDEVVFADVLRGRFNVIGTDPVPKQDLTADIFGNYVMWTQSGNVVSLDLLHFGSLGVTVNGLNNRKPQISNKMAVWVGSDGSNDQIWSYNFNGGIRIQITTTASNKNNPHVFYIAADDRYMVSWENENNGISYWENQSATPTTRIAHTPASGCNNEIIKMWQKVVLFIEHCSDGDTTRVFSAGTDLSSAADDIVLEGPDGASNLATAPDVTVDGTTIRLVWVEGSGTSAEIWACKNVTTCVNPANRTRITNNSVLDDDPHIADQIIVYHTQNADGTHDIKGYDLSDDTAFTVTNDAQEDTSPRLVEIGSSNRYWGGWIRTPAGGNKEIFVMVPQITTPTGSNVLVTFGGGSKVTYPTVSVAGTTTLITKSFVSQPTVPLTGFQLGDNPTYYDLSTTASWSGTATVCLDYYGANFNVTESLLQILHLESGVWTDRTTALDTINDNICAGVTSFSEIAFAVRQPTIITQLNSSSSFPMEPTVINILGSGFLTGPNLRLVNNTLDINLGNITFTDSSSLLATVPAFLIPTTYDVYLDNRYGSGAYLATGFTVSVPTVDQMKDYLTSKGANPNPATGLVAHLQSAYDFYLKGDTAQAQNQMDIFQNQLETAISHPLNII